MNVFARVPSVPRDDVRLLAPPQTRIRLLVCFAVGILFAILQYYSPERATDFDETYAAAQAWLAGEDPYHAMQLASEAHRFKYPLVYPGTAILIVSPFTKLPLLWALLLWTGISTIGLAWALTRREWWGLLGLVSAASMQAFIHGQWSPMMTAAMVLPSLGFLWSAKPTIGLALFIARPSWRAAVGCAVLVLVSLVLVPGWPTSMRETVKAVPQVVPLITRPGGILLLLAFLRWRTPEGRLLGSLACVPQTPMLYEMVPLLLIPRGFRQIAIGTILTLIAAQGSFMTKPEADFFTRMQVDWPWFLVLVYLPCLFLVLLRPNVSPESAADGATQIERLNDVRA